MDSQTRQRDLRLQRQWDWPSASAVSSHVSDLQTHPHLQSRLKNGGLYEYANQETPQHAVSLSLVFKVNKRARISQVLILLPIYLTECTVTVATTSIHR